MIDWKKSLLPEQSLEHWQWGNLHGSALSLTISQATLKTPRLIVILGPDTLTCHQIETELNFFLQNQPELPILTFPDRETLPYDIFSPHQDIISERLATLNWLLTLKHGILLAAIPTVMHYLTPHNFLERHSFVLDQGDRIDSENFRKRLTEAGYHNVNQVIEHGEFAMRGSIIDLFPMGSEFPYRIDLLDDEVDSIRRFDPDTQKTIETINKIRLLPAREFPLDEATITYFRQNWRNRFAGNPLQSPIYQAISDAKSFPGIEYYLSLFYEKLNTLFDYLPKDSLIFKIGNLNTAAHQFWEEVNKRYTARNIDITRPLLPPPELFLRPDELFHAVNQFSQIQTSIHEVKEAPHHINFASHEPPELFINRQEKQPLQKLQHFIAQPNLRILICAESPGRREVILSLLYPNKITPRIFETWQEFFDSNEKLAITVAPVEQGLWLDHPAIALISETQIFGLQVTQIRKVKRTRIHDADAVVRDLMELAVDAPIVHIDHGVGRYRGLQHLKLDNEENEYLVIEYAGGDILYVPVSSLHLISRYTGPDSEHPPINKLGTDQWEKAKRKAAEKIHDVAVELLELYAKRAAKKGFAIKTIDGQYATFASAFPFELTLDQEKAIQDIFKDMTTEKIMDRLICGDVGFGKTEVAMRAAFLTVLNEKQVALLVPTTILAQQHYQTFRDRFADWPFTIDLISRFRTTKEQTEILEKLTEHKIDILIGTHKLLQKNIRFKNLGLLIVDEEHRFGVKQKERLKELRAEIDLLTLTATPIPRTLNMAISGIRDLSIISTPPARRMAIKTFVMEKNSEIIREAILRELMRGGQVYYVHNEIESIEKIVRELQDLVPEAKIAIGHGQMRKRELEKIMTDFYHHRNNVLVCTTIIESGIDIPTTNTIIIERADKFGLAQLHQLRGRVGRSHHQAYAYLLTPPEKQITPDAEKRLEVIANLEELGAGFMLATHDLEIRGTGEILGAEQSGNMQAIGFSLYMELLEKAVKTLKANETFSLENIQTTATEVNINVPALIPENYVPDVHTRLILYKRIANAKNLEHLTDLQVEIIDRFGLLPPQLQNLFRATQIKLTAEKIGIRKLEANSKGGLIQFIEKPHINPTQIIKLIQQKPKSYQFAGPNNLRFSFLSEISKDNLIDQVEQVLAGISSG